MARSGRQACGGRPPVTGAKLLLQPAAVMAAPAFAPGLDPLPAAGIALTAAVASLPLWLAPFGAG